MSKILCDFRFLLLLAAAAFIYIQMRLFATQSEYADRLAAAVESENHCTSQMRLLIDQISMQQGRIVALEEEKNRQDEVCGQLKALVQDLERKGLQRLIDKVQDGSDPNVRSKALSYDQLTYMQHLDNEPVHTESPGELIAYYKIARHYKWAMDELFYKHNFSRVIILEDDMEIAPDFFEYFEAAAALLDNDKSIMAVSSWNDNGQKQFVHDPTVLYRSDFFPGLGWMLSRATWNELSPKWPKAYPCWLKENHKGRQFIRPEVCRTYNFGEHGSSLGQFFKQYLEPIKLNDVKVDWKSMDLSYLKEDKYTKYFAELVKNAKSVHGADAVLKAYNIDGDVRIQYQDQLDFERIARQFGIFYEWKDGIPRTAYKGVVVFRHQTPRRIFLVGPDSLRQLGIESA
ncbi:hypothetical protein L1049_015999 [Liquidambar formosana]|uniref:Alpha-1,3-mannosyl-glycoprotein 2-beta-N-acetylglucosaminyltransferase n=1 Tax=Liquidambar formosana TaxID=63359 RepID=A0AAP0S0M2_LIQFO